MGSSPDKKVRSVLLEGRGAGKGGGGFVYFPLLLYFS